MTDQQLQLTEWAQQLAGLVVLASCAAMANPVRREGARATAVEDSSASFRKSSSATSELLGTRLSDSQASLPQASPQDMSVKRRSPRKDDLSSEVREFMQYPVRFQRQLLEYGRRYISANFEAKNSENA